MKRAKISKAVAREVLRIMTELTSGRRERRRSFDTEDRLTADTWCELLGVLGHYGDMRARHLLPHEAFAIEHFKICSCGAAFSFERWQELNCPGLMVVVSGHTLEMRDCPVCESTMAMVMLPVPLDIHEALEEIEEMRARQGKDAA